jgi:cbb3-type cytochrome oxidase maturation protein
MELVFVALPVALLVGGAALVAFVWAAKSDQFEDLDTPPTRVLFDEQPAGRRNCDADDGQCQRAAIRKESHASATNALDQR